MPVFKRLRAEANERRMRFLLYLTAKGLLTGRDLGVLELVIERGRADNEACSKKRSDTPECVRIDQCLENVLPF
jgi:hypothetical protein